MKSMLQKHVGDKYSNVWITPIETFQPLNNEFKFDVDVATEPDNPLGINKFFTKEDNSLTKEWHGNVWLNPPYEDIDIWTKKAYEEYERDKSRVIVMLLPARTDTKYFHKYIRPHAEVRFIEGRLKFSDKGSAPFPSIVVVYGRPANLIRQERGY